MIELNPENFDAEVLQAKWPVLVEFYKPNGCMNCERMETVLDEFEKKNPEVKVCYYACRDEFDEKGRRSLKRDVITDRYPFEVFPGIFGFLDGKLIRGMIWVQHKSQLNLLFMPIETLKIMLAEKVIEQQFFVQEIQNYNKWIHIISEKTQEDEFVLGEPTFTDADAIPCEGCQ